MKTSGSFQLLYIQKAIDEGQKVQYWRVFLSPDDRLGIVGTQLRNDIVAFVIDYRDIHHRGLWQKHTSRMVVAFHYFLKKQHVGYFTREVNAFLQQVYMHLTSMNISNPQTISWRILKSVHNNKKRYWSIFTDFHNRMCNVYSDCVPIHTLFLL